ncbi:hypothetical protein AMTR_s00024p00249700 [Amborella trichopoda]|uniref:Uncharacterized protein n=1 Tax=Amborella trichopoda TaxID=13333 RepID=W1PU19_AMBTC|nr:hypothetical protein AMTR_s00024p00249700 [Amborella trichopoda]
MIASTIILRFHNHGLGQRLRRFAPYWIHPLFNPNKLGLLNSNKCSQSNLVLADMCGSSRDGEGTKLKRYSGPMGVYDSTSGKARALLIGVLQISAFQLGDQLVADRAYLNFIG